MDLVHSCSDSGCRRAANAGDDGGAEDAQYESCYDDVPCELVDLIGHGPLPVLPYAVRDLALSSPGVRRIALSGCHSVRRSRFVHTDD